MPASSLLVTTCYKPKGAQLQVWDAREWIALRTLAGALRIKGTSRDGKLLLVTGERDEATVLDTTTWQPLWHRAGTPDVALSPDGRSVAVIRPDRTGYGVDIESILSRTVRARYAHVNELGGFSSDGALLAAGEQDGFGPWLIDLRSRHPRRVDIPVQKDRMVSAVAWSTAPGRLWTGDDDGGLRLYQCRGWRVLRRLQGQTARIRRIDVSPDDALIAASARGDSVDLWDSSGELLAQSIPTKTPFPGVAFSGDANVLVVPSGSNLEIYRRQP